MKKFDTILYEEDDGVAIVTLNRPQVHNAFDQRMQAELREIWLTLRSRVEVRAVILTGAGEKAFCSGIDRTEAIDIGYIQDEEAREKMNFATGFVSTPFQYNDPGDEYQSEVERSMETRRSGDKRAGMRGRVLPARGVGHHHRG